MAHWNQFLSGAMFAMAAAIGLFFLRFWRRSGDRLFLLFAIAFWILAANRLALSLLSEEREGQTFAYGIRLLAFVLIIVAVVDKNRPR